MNPEFFFEPAEAVPESSINLIMTKLQLFQDESMPRMPVGYENCQD